MAEINDKQAPNQQAPDKQSACVAHDAQPDQSHCKKGGRPRKDPSTVKRQCSFCLTDEVMGHLRDMALAYGCSGSELLARLIEQAYDSKHHLTFLSDLSAEARADLNRKRAAQLRNTRARRLHVDELNFKRGQGEIGGVALANVMVIVAPKAVTSGAKDQLQEGLRIPGIFCANLGDVWLVPYGLLKGIDPVELISYPCYASVLDYFAGRAIPAAQLSSFVAQHSSFTLSSAAEKATLAKLAQHYGARLPQVNESYQLKSKARQAERFKNPLDEFLVLTDD